MFYRLITICICIVIALTAVLQPRISDDYTYQNAFAKYSFEGYAKGLYNDWSGRIVNTFVMKAYTYNDLTHYGSGFINALAFLAFPYLIFISAVGKKFSLLSIFKKRKYAFIYLVSLLSLWFSLPILGECFFWRSGAGSYLWPLLIGFVFLSPYLAYLFRSEYRKLSFYHAFWLFPVGVALGVSQLQQISAVTIGLLVCAIYVYLKKINIRSIPYSLYAGIIGFISGSVIFLLAPGNYTRHSDMTSGSDHNFLVKILGNLIEFAKRFYYMLDKSIWPLLLIVILLGFIIVLNKRNIQSYLQLFEIKSSDKSLLDLMKNNNQVALFFIWLIIGFSSLLPLLIISDFAAKRTFVFFFVYLNAGLISLIYFYRDAIWKSVSTIKLSRYIVTFLILFFLIDTMAGLYQSITLWKGYDDRESFILEQKEKQNLDVIVEPIDIRPHRAIYSSDISKDPEFWHNKQISELYGINSIRVKDTEEEAPSIIKK